MAIEGRTTIFIYPGWIWKIEAPEMSAPSRLAMLKLRFSARLTEIDGAISRQNAIIPGLGIALPDEKRLAWLEGRREAFLNAISDIEEL